MNTKQTIIKLHQIKQDLREARATLIDAIPQTAAEQVSFNAARQGVEASEAELHSAIVALQMGQDLTDSK